ncbi:MAG: hypothetical protein F6K08_03125 [Okeania sp. SIO1H6]|nr:hypothetical protein [Okeania sp. SIO1H6]
MSETEEKPRTWTDTSYSLASTSLLYVANATHGEAVALKCPGHQLAGKGFSIEFRVEQLNTLKNLVAELEAIEAAK